MPRPFLNALHGSALVLAMVLASGSVRAQTPPVQTPPDPQAQAEARQHFQMGAQHYQAQHFSQAIEEFRTAYRLLPTPVILFNLAQAYRGDGRLSEAITAFRQFVTESPHLTDTQRQDVETAIAEIESQRAVLSFEVEPAGGTLILDGREVGTLPLPRAIEVLPGEHTIEIRLDRHVTRTDTITLRPHQRRLFNATLETVVQSGRILVHAIPEDTEVTVDGVRVGSGRVSRDVDPGEHSVFLHHGGYADVTRRFHLDVMNTESINVTMASSQPLYASPIFWSLVAVGAGLVVGGVYIGTHVGERSPIQGNTPPYVVQSLMQF